MKTPLICCYKLRWVHCRYNVQRWKPKNLQAMKVEQVLYMVGGSGDTSYASNSKIQENAISKAKFLVQEAVSKLYCSLLPDSFIVADLGCSSGPNGLTVVNEILEAIEESCHLLNRSAPEVQFFMNDLPGNDFNNLFRSVAPFEKEFIERKGERFVPFYLAGVPVSYFRRVFPKKSIHFMHSSYSLQWLSQVPQELEGDVSNTTLNKDNIYITKSSPPLIIKAYLKQFQMDFTTFLKSRGEEIITGGRMVITILGRKNYGEYFFLWDLMAKALNAMVSEGKLQKKRLQDFNLPFYAPSKEEIKQVIQKEGSFHLEQVHTFESNWDALDDREDGFVIDNIASGENISKAMRAVLESILASHFGDAIIDDLFAKFAQIVAEHLLKEKTKFVNVLLSLKKI